MAGFFSIHREVNPDGFIHFCDTVKTRRGNERTIALKDLATEIEMGVVTTGYEVLYFRGHRYSLFFDLDHDYTGDPANIDNFIADLLMKCRVWFAKMLGNVPFVVSEAHRGMRVSFHVVFPTIIATKDENRNFAKYLKIVADIPMDTTIYNRRRLMRPVGCNGEKPDSVVLKPHPNFAGIFSDHIIQTPRSSAVRLSPQVISTMIIRYVTFDDDQAELSEIDPHRLDDKTFIKYMNHLKSLNFRELFDFKLKEKYSDYRGSGGKQRDHSADMMWNTMTPEFLNSSEIVEMKRTSSYTVHSRLTLPVPFPSTFGASPTVQQPFVTVPFSLPPNTFPAPGVLLTPQFRSLPRPGRVVSSPCAQPVILPSRARSHHLASSPCRGVSPSSSSEVCIPVPPPPPLPPVIITPVVEPVRDEVPQSVPTEEFNVMPTLSERQKSVIKKLIDDKISELQEISRLL